MGRALEEQWSKEQPLWSWQSPEARAIPLLPLAALPISLAGCKEELKHLTLQGRAFKASSEAPSLPPWLSAPLAGRAPPQAAPSTSTPCSHLPISQCRPA